MAIITTTLVSTILGAVTGALPDVIDLFKQKEDNRHALDMMKAKADYAEQAAKHELEIKNVEADIREGDNLRIHDASLDGGRFLNALRASVRPVLTYFFFFACFYVFYLNRLYLFISQDFC